MTISLLYSLARIDATLGMSVAELVVGTPETDHWIWATLPSEGSWFFRVRRCSVPNVCAHQKLGHDY
jgi:hypothetical protein